MDDATDKAVPTAGGDVTGAATAVADFALHPTTVATVKAVQSTMPPASNWAEVAVGVLQSLGPFLQPALEIGRASSRTSAEVALGYTVLMAALSAFHPHPGAAP